MKISYSILQVLFVLCYTFSTSFDIFYVIFTLFPLHSFSLHSSLYYCFYLLNWFFSFQYFLFYAFYIIFRWFFLIFKLFYINFTQLFHFLPLHLHTFLLFNISLHKFSIFYAFTFFHYFYSLSTSILYFYTFILHFYYIFYILIYTHFFFLT